MWSDGEYEPSDRSNGGSSGQNSSISEQPARKKNKTITSDMEVEVVGVARARTSGEDEMTSDGDMSSDMEVEVAGVGRAKT